MLSTLQIQQIKTIALCHGYETRIIGPATVAFGSWTTVKKELIDDLKALNIHLEDFINDTKDGGSYQFNRIAYACKTSTPIHKPV